MPSTAVALEEIAELGRLLTKSNGSSAASLNKIAQLYKHCESSDLHVVAEALKAIGRVLTHHRALASAAAAAATAAATAAAAAAAETPPPGGAASPQDAGAAAAAGDAAPAASEALGAAAAADPTRSGAGLQEWLQQHGKAYFAVLARLAASADPHAQVCGLRLALAAVRGEAEEARAAALAGRGLHAMIPDPHRRLQDFISELLLAERWSDHVTRCLIGEFVVPFVDVRHYLVSHLRSCAEHLGRFTPPPEGKEEAAPAAKRRRRAAPFADLLIRRGRNPDEFFTRAVALLREMPEPTAGASPQEDEGSGEAKLMMPTGRPAGFFQREYRKLFQDCWLRILGLRVPADQTIALFQFLPNHVMPHLSQPLMLADFYLRAFSQGTTEVSVLSLSGLLLLLTRYGLADPETLSSTCDDYYARLYTLLKPETFKLKRRARFQRLAAASLMGGLLPARFAAAFAKRCMRLAVMSSEPSTVMWLLSVAYSLIQKHHSHCRFLLHRPSADPQPELKQDPYSDEASLTEAIGAVATTSLWELQLLRRHNVPAVATLTKLFLKPFFKPSAKKLDPELFLSQTTDSLYKQVLKNGERQVARLAARGERCPLAFRVEDNVAADRIAAWAGALSTSQRRIGPGK